MKLYIYDHCPFCVRVRMIFGLRAVPLEEVILLNDDETTPIHLIGVKQVPILEKEDGTHIGESLDIVHFIDKYAGKDLLKEEIRDEIQTWFEDANQYINKLVQPRFVKASLPEFATQSAIDYFVKKKTRAIGNFEVNLLNTKKYLERAHIHLNKLTTLIQDAEALNGELSLEDIIIFPILRNLTIVKGLILPPEILRYVKNMSAKSKVSLYFDCAI